MALEQAGVALIAQGASAYFGDLKNAESATNGFVDATEKGGGRVNAAGQVMIGALRQVGAIAVEAFGQALKATGAFIGDSIDLAGDFEAGMLNFQAVAGKSVDTSGLEEFRDLFIQIGKELPVSTSEVQMAATEMIKGGIDPAIVAAGGLRQNIQFAAAAMEGDLVKAAEISSKILGGWADSSATAQQKADFLTHSTDLLTKAANASAVDVEGLSLGIFNAQGIAKTAGVSFDDLTTTLAALAPRFASSSEAGNSLKNMIARLQPQTANQTGAMQALGLYTEEAGSAFYDAQGNFVGFEQSAQLLQDSLKGLTKEQQASLLQTIFGNDAMGSAAALADMGAEGYRNMAGAMAEANGVADAAALKQQGFNTALDNAKGSVEALQITIGSALLPKLEDLLNNVIAPGVNTLTDLAGAIFGDKEAFDKLSPAMQDVVTFAEDVGVAIDDLMGLFDRGITVSSDLSSAIDDLSGIWEKAGEVVADVLGGYQDIIDSVLPQVQQFIDEHGDEISAFFKETWDSIIEIVNLALDLYDSIVPPILHAIADFIDDHGSEIQRIFEAVWDTVTTIIGGALDLIKGIIKLAIDAINGDWDAVWTDIQGITKTITDTIGGTIEGFLNIIAGFFDTSVGEIVTLWQNNWDQLVEIATQTDWIQVGRDVVEGVVNGVRGAAEQLIDAMIDMAKDAWEAVKDFFGIDSPSVLWAETVGAPMVLGIMKGFGDTWPALTSLVEGMGEDLIDQAAELGRSVQSAIASSFGATASIDRQIASNLDRFEDVPDQYRQFTEGALRDAEHAARQFLDPTEGAQFFKMRSDQILEFAKLQKDLAETQDSEERKRIQTRMNLINRAQTAEINAFNANLGAGLSGTEQLMGDLQSFMAAKGVDAQGNSIGLPGILENQTIATFADWLGQLTNYAPNPYRNPMMSSAPVNNNQRTYNMPVYTNNSPEALQQSAALMGAMYP